ncbi:MAG: dihydrolipoamide acetyltransferase family protein, partial [Ornithinimicrobium sp.]
TQLPPRVARKRRRRGSASLAQDAGSPAEPSVAAIKVISPLVRRAAAVQGVDLRHVQPSGPHGIIRRADIGSAATEHAARTATSTPEAPRPEASTPTSSRDLVRIPLQGMRGAVAQKVSRSHTEIPDATAWVDVDATEFMAAAAAMARRRAHGRSGVLPLLARTVVAGLAQFPELNASVDMEAGEIIQHGEVNLGIAMQTTRGLVVPVISGAEQMTTDDLAASLEALTERARNGSLSPDDMLGGTFTLNNYGVFGVDGSTPILNHPEAGMIGVGRIIRRPWAHDGEIALRAVGQVSMTFDHRVCDGGSAAGLLRFVADCMEDPTVLLAHL